MKEMSGIKVGLFSSVKYLSGDVDLTETNISVGITENDKLQMISYAKKNYLHWAPSYKRNNY